MNKLIYLYIETYLNKNKIYSNLKAKLKSLTNVANVGSASSFPNHTLDVFGNARVIG